MLGRVYSCAVLGLDGALVKVEVDIAPGLPVFNVVGLGRYCGPGSARTGARGDP